MPYLFTKRISFLSILFLMTITFSCNSPSAKIEKVNREKFAKFEFHKLVGKWSQDNHNNQFIEEWQYDKDSSLVGIAYEIVGEDTLKIDKLKIKDLNHRAQFGAAVRNRYLGDFLWFEEEKSNNSTIVFQNQNSGYPHEITYTILSNTKISVSVEGEINRKTIKNEYVYTKK